ncbi:MAG: M28 family peptidase, partial [Lentihominibacter sp.]
MHKKIISVIFAFALTLSLTACGKPDYSESFTDFEEAIDTEYGKEIIKNISSFGDDPVTGNRSAGSPAESQVLDYLKAEMENIGLKNVTSEEITVDTWLFKGADLTFIDADGKEKKINLGSYQTTLQADNEELELVYVNKGTAADYEGIDVTGKLVLLDVDQNEDWWINYPAYQAKVKGAKAVIAMSVYPEEGPDRIGVQDVCGPADAPALAISEEDSKALQKAIKDGNGESITVTLNADSKVTEDGTSHNLWGEIPGKTDETIFLFAHMDGYFHSAYDDAQGAAVSMSIAKAIIDSGYKPDKTIRICMHGSEEWGVSGSEYDWSTG